MVNYVGVNKNQTDRLQDIKDNQTDGDAKTQITQEVIASAGNTSSTNLASGATWTGTAVSTLGVVGLQWNLYATENCTIYSEESPDGINWDISYSFDYIASKGGQGETVQATQAYWRLRVKNEGADTTTAFRVSGILCPIATPLPSSLSDDSRLKSESTLTGKENSDRHVWASPTNTLGVNETVRLVGTNFDGTVKDTNFWTETVTNSGTVVQTGEIKLQTNTTANGTATYESVRRARFVVGSAIQFTGAFKFNDTVTEADNLRRLGAYDDDNGFFFQLDSGVFSVGSRKETSDTLVSSGSFNGNMGDSFTPDETRYYKLDIEYTPMGAFYYVNGKLLHKSIGGHLTRFLTLPIRLENINDNANATAVVMDCLGVVIVRLGRLETNATYKYITGAASTLCKVGAGDLHTIVVTNNSGDISVYDGTTAGGDLISVIDGAKVNGTMSFNAPFSDGLFIVTTAAATITVTYE